MTAAPPAPTPRHALGLPAGSVRALLAFGVLGYLWLLVLMPPTREENKDQAALAFVSLQFLMVLILAHFFTAHGGSIGARGQRSPLYLPRGTVRLVLLAGYLGLAYYLYDRGGLPFEFPKLTQEVLLLPLILVTAFFLGHFISAALRTFNQGYVPPWYQDMEAWVAIVALLILGIVIMILVINRSLPDTLIISTQYLEAALAGLVGIYFGARS